MKVLQVNATYGLGSTGTIVRDLKHHCQANGIECYVPILCKQDRYREYMMAWKKV